MSHLGDLATELATAEDRFARGDIKAGYLALSLMSTMARQINDATKRLTVAVDHAEMDAAFAKERAR